jgi:hypothetical protein
LNIQLLIYFATSFLINFWLLYPKII